MPTALVTGSGGLVGSESVRHCVEQGYDVIGLENDMRARFFGPDASTRPTTRRLVQAHPEFRSLEVDVRDQDAVTGVVRRHRRSLELVVHTAAQPSHDWAASDVRTDFAVNAQGTLNVLEAVRAHCPEATFVFCSTNKVYGDRPNGLPLEEHDTRLELPADHPWFAGVDTSMSIDRSLHSLFGASKVAADVLVQEYGNYFGMPTVCFRAGCLSGPGHAGAQAHGFLSYLMRCAITGQRYTVYGHAGKQVRDNLDAADVVTAFAAFHRRPRAGAVYNLGGGRDSNCSVLEAIALTDRIAARGLDYEVVERARIGDHRWWISDLGEFRRDYPQWRVRHGIEQILRKIHDDNVDRWSRSSYAA